MNDFKKLKKKFLDKLQNTKDQADAMKAGLDLLNDVEKLLKNCECKKINEGEKK